MIPKHRLNLGLSWHPWPWATISFGITYVSSQFFRGDEANTQRPLPAYWVMKRGLVEPAGAASRCSPCVNNLLNNKYENFGTFAPTPAGTARPVVRLRDAAPPVNVVGGLRYTF